MQFSDFWKWAEINGIRLLKCGWFMKLITVWVFSFDWIVSRSHLSHAIGGLLWVIFGVHYPLIKGLVASIGVSHKLRQSALKKWKNHIVHRGVPVRIAHLPKTNGSDQVAECLVHIYESICQLCGACQYMINPSNGIH